MIKIDYKCILKKLNIFLFFLNFNHFFCISIFILNERKKDILETKSSEAILGRRGNSGAINHGEGLWSNSL